MQQSFKNGLDGKERILSAEYTSTHWNYKEAKKKIQVDFTKTTAQLQELRNCNAKKDEEIWCLQQKLHAL